MSHNSVVGRITHAATHINDIEKIGTNLWHSATHLSDWNPFSKPPQLQTPTATGVDPASTTQGALQNQVSQEAASRWSRTAFGSSPAQTSLLDSENDTSRTNTASRVLLGGS